MAEETPKDEVIQTDAASPNTEQIQKFTEAIEKIMGTVTLLCMRSARHKFLFAADMEWMFLPAVLKKQFRIFRDAKNNSPIAYVSWAKVSSEVEDKFKAGQTRLKPQEWSSGDKIYIVDVIAPLGGEQQILARLAEGEFKDSTACVLSAAAPGKPLESKLLKDLVSQAK